ncbi:BadF/BadG/BcrA/BcrD ATPase family protein [Gymnodinialimonas ceratoperidinii]|uniref:ATPase n=1 Tax=Gymnodinialimonas ceratoperidinii TaxID=2856823 RepID=A0A8F6YE45_9RHOB|nr:BadF/BadG/BcrA/BcrD ATPase family protein [Gymnodinialimonas ceratoperidinii]QXT40852.1 ATPase [Gymnodinialimonas ceratoperidinii]
MAEQSLTSRIGIDGGGTNCRFALVLDGTRYDLRRGGANASTDMAGTIATLRDGLSSLAQEAGVSIENLSSIPAHIGLAGVMDAAMGAEIAAQLPLRCVRVEDDRRTAMSGALGHSDGCVLGIGTGSFIGRRAAGVERVIGGWGLVLGDVASGAYLGRGLLSRILESADGLFPPSDLTQQVLAEIGSTAAIVSFAAQAAPADFARFAPRIIEAAHGGDPNARALVIDSAQQIAQRLRHLGWEAGEKIVPIGGLAPAYAPFLPPEMAENIGTPEGTSLDGALTLAATVTAT